MWLIQLCEDNLVQALPFKDSRPHFERGKYCPCKPRIDNNIVIHNAWDGREFEEIEKDYTITKEGLFPKVIRAN